MVVLASTARIYTTNVALKSKDLFTLANSYRGVQWASSRVFEIWYRGYGLSNMFEYEGHFLITVHSPYIYSSFEVTLLFEA